MTVGVDLNVRNLAVITLRQHGQIIETVFVRDHGLDRARYLHLKKISKKQYLSGKPIKGEQSNQQLWRHVRRMNEDAAHKVARIIASACTTYPGCILLFERLRKIKRGGAANPGAGIAASPISCAAKSTSTRKRKIMPRAWSRSK